jgi:hypothetical protein
LIFFPVQQKGAIAFFIEIIFFYASRVYQSLDKSIDHRMPELLYQIQEERLICHISNVLFLFMWVG